MGCGLASPTGSYHLAVEQPPHQRLDGSVKLVGLRKVGGTGHCGDGEPLDQGEDETSGLCGREQ